MDDLMVVDGDVTLHELSAALAAELALGISSREDILQRHGVSGPQWEVLRRAPAFRQMVSEAVREWNSDLNASARTKLKAQVLAEDGLRQLDVIVHDTDTPPAARIEAYKVLTRVAGIAEPDRDTGGSGFRVNIVLGGGQGVTIDGEQTKQVADA